MVKAVPLPRFDAPRSMMKNIVEGAVAVDGTEKLIVRTGERVEVPTIV